jgi:DNA polymerase-3 subunit gamma/tau
MVSSSSSKLPYKVLARQYRPQKLSELVGQDTLVKILTQSIERNRLPHAFLLHGIRGVGKTTTARILAKAINCTGEDGQGSLTPDPCGVCEDCLAISGDRHLDVVEMDAASRTGVDDIREVIEAARYKAVKGRYKIYIIDEVHMLSKSAFNALLKTLEEPPPHVIFIFATTEIRKIPETVLSRCMRFDLKRLEPKCLFDHFSSILKKENVIIEEEALSLIVRAADGSARDGLSLLDQAISLSEKGMLTALTVRNMLGLIDRGHIFTLLGKLLQGEVGNALSHLRDLYGQGGDAIILMENLLELTYWLTCLKTAPQLQNDVTWPESDRLQGTKIIENLPVSALMRVWQVLHKGYEEISRSPLPFQATEMVLVRVAYLSDLPHAEDLLAGIHNVPRTPLETRGSLFLERMPVAPQEDLSPAFQPTLKPMVNAVEIASSMPEPAELPQEINPPISSLEANVFEESMPDFESMLEILKQAREPMLYTQVVQDVHLVSYTPGLITIRLARQAEHNLPTKLQKFLETKTGQSWIIKTVSEEGHPTIDQRNKTIHKAAIETSRNHPLVQSLAKNFPNAVITVK